MKQKILLRFSVLCLMLFLLCTASCFAEEATAPNGNDDTSSMPDFTDMTAYGLEAEDPSFIRFSLSETLEFVQAKGTGLLLFTADWCPFCQYAVPLLDEALKSAEYTAYLIDADDVDHEAEAEVYEELCAYLEAYLEPHEDGEVLDIPEVIAVKDGEIVGHHYALLSTFRTPQVRAGEEMTAEQKDELVDYYAELIRLIETP